MTSPAAADAFSDHAHEYDAVRRRLVHGYDDFYGAVVEVVRRVEGGVGRVLDLGAGTGLLTQEIAGAFPEARVEVLDASEPMLRYARERLGDRVGAVHVADMGQWLPDGPYDAVVSALAIHHLEHPAQRRLFAAVRERLRPGGVFVNAEQVTTAVPQLRPAYDAQWYERNRAAGATEHELHAARTRMVHDRCADAPTLLSWLAEAGFANVDCVYKTWQLAVLAGFTAPEEAT